MSSFPSHPSRTLRARFSAGRFIPSCLGFAAASWVAQAATDRVAIIDDFSVSPVLLELTQSGSLSQSGTLASTSPFAAGARTVLLDTGSTPPARRASAEVLDSFSKYFFSVGPGVEASSVLRYEAPPAGALDLTLDRKANALGFTLDFSQTPVNIEVTIETPGQPAKTVSLVQKPVSEPTDVLFPYAQFGGIDFTQSSAITVKLSGVNGQGAPDLIASGVSLMHVTSVPEPSVVLYSLTASLFLLRRRRLRP
ncbi:hypothetical protein [Haloferula sargassicola]|uniref:PEP-CTERM protein-sorting domain-containing protein n=1 Tax=Haloferula sargassicola TaxID=490096 RepID=A0ABP9UQC8_9BACT